MARTGLEIQQLFDLINLAAETRLDDHARGDLLSLLRANLQERAELLCAE